METKQGKRGPGRPAGPPTERYMVLLEPEDAAWAMAQPGGMSALFRRLVRQARQQGYRTPESDMPPISSALNAGKTRHAGNPPPGGAGAAPSEDDEGAGRETVGWADDDEEEDEEEELGPLGLALDFVPPEVAEAVGYERDKHGAFWPAGKPYDPLALPPEFAAFIVEWRAWAHSGGLDGDEPAPPDVLWPTGQRSGDLPGYHAHLRALEERRRASWGPFGQDYDLVAPEVLTAAGYVQERSRDGGGPYFWPADKPFEPHPMPESFTAWAREMRAWVAAGRPEGQEPVEPDLLWHLGDGKVFRSSDSEWYMGEDPEAVQSSEKAEQRATAAATALLNRKQRRAAQRGRNEAARQKPKPAPTNGKRRR